MAVSALELRPRGAVAILDAALRLCSRNTGVWALTVPTGALVTGALLHLVDAVLQRQSLALPTLWLTLAWLARGLFQGAACHYLQELVLGQKEPGVMPSLRAALERAPSLIITVGYLFLFNFFSIGLSLGMAFFMLSAHIVGYAATMQGQDSPLKLYGTCSRLLGPARAIATGVRMLLLVQLLTFLNLHIAFNAFFWLSRKLLAIDFTFAERFASLDNPFWLFFLAALTFTLFEPIKAATATLLLVDGRVRQEGLDLLAAVKQLPERATVRPGHRGAAAFLLCLLLSGTAVRAQAPEQVPVSELRQRLETVADECEYSQEQLAEQLDATSALSPAEQAKLGRLVRTVENHAYEDENCERATQALEQGLTLAQQTAQLERAAADSKAASARARDILSRPEFGVTPPTDKTAEEQEKQPPGWWQQFMDWLSKMLKKLFESDRDPVRSSPNLSPSSGADAAKVLVILLFGLALAVVVALLVRTFLKRDEDTAQLEVSTYESSALAQDPMSALSRPPEGWAHLADELAAKGEYREAVRSLYLALLSRLHREGAILYDSTLSNWDYLRTFKGRREWLPPFRELTRRFDFAWYGNLPVGADGYRDFRALTQPMLAAPSTQEAPGA
ncbi:MAG TPA: DUF4129 domain-containing protein [Myxococcaceae bacterium]|nr:DUF4129 domain-containing protein [Myxococcaceae bacterium]